MKTPNHPSPRLRRSATEWAALVAAFSKSELSVAAFCNQHDITPISLRNWIGRIRRASHASSGLAFTPVRLAKAKAPARAKVLACESSGHLEILLSNGRTLRIYGAVAPAQLAAVLAVAEANTSC